nr:integrase core domain-containing protein [Deinococcus misasensis]
MRGETLKFLVFIDEFTRECLSVTVKPNFRSADVQEVLRSVIQTRGAPDFLRSDNGSDFIASELRIFLGLLGVRTKYIEPGKPYQNGNTESFNARFREKCLNREVFHKVWEASVVTGRFRDHHNQVRLHSGLGYLPPVEFKAKWDASRVEIS